MKKKFTLFLLLFSICFGTLQAQTEYKLFAWGENLHGELGLGDISFERESAPVRVGTATNWASVAAGGAHSLGIKSDGTLWTWGINYYGQLGDGTFIDKATPVKVGHANNWVSIVAGSTHSLAIKSDGTLWAWGENRYYQLGDGSRFNKNTPQQIGSDTDWVSISAAFLHSLALKSDGTLWAWGNNGYYTLGDGTNITQSAPIQVGTANDWISIEAGDFHSLAIKKDGTLWAWGNNQYGQLGDGTTTNKSTPMQVGTSTDWVSIKAGGFHSLALKSDGTIWSWGRNNDGQLGDGTTTNKSTPIQVGTANDWTAIDANNGHSLGLKSDGIWIWGIDIPDYTSDGSGPRKTTPVRVSSATHWAKIAAGGWHSLAMANLSTNAALSALKISSGTLSPIFSSGTFSYSTTVNNLASSVTIIPTVAYPTATVKVNGTTVPSRSASSGISLNTGSNIISVEVTAEDGRSTQTYTIDVNRLDNTAPELATIGNKTVDELTELSFTATATDSDAGQTLTYSLVGAATGAAFTEAGEFSWTPSEEQGPDSYTFTVKVTDNGSPALSDEEEITVTVNEVNQAAVFTSEAVVSAREGEAYLYQLTATDADLPANTLTYEAVDIPSWLSFDPATQILSGTPDKTAEVSNLIRLQVSDGQEISTQEFILEVEITTGLFDKYEQEHMLVYPNPTKGGLIIELGTIAAEEKVTLTLLSLEGRILIQKHGSLQKGVEIISAYLQKAKMGTYLLQVQTKDSIRSIKVIKE